MPGKIPVLMSILQALENQVSGLRNKLAFTRSLNEQRSDTTLALVGEKDVLGKELLELQQKIADVAELQRKNEEENFKRRYINEGLAKFSEILRTKSNDIHALGNAFIHEMVKYLNAIQGGFFLFDDSDPGTPVLNLISAFAYNRKKYLQKTVAFGEGLVGSCAREKQYINLTEIPQGYISITSGLGDTLPDNLLLMPVLHENELIGVLEIASLHKYKEHEITFAGEVAHSLGSTIVYTRNNQRTADLLAKSQQQALEMAEQEEEMRQNMEELKATQEESSRREEEFKGIADAIERALFIIEYDLDGRISHVNDRFCIFTGCAYDEIIGRPHQEILHGTLVPDRKFWDELQQNTQLTYVEKVKIGKSTIRLKEHFTMVQNRDGLTVKYINFATDD
jgi:PAS domain S-box-containing protein